MGQRNINTPQVTRLRGRDSNRVPSEKSSEALPIQTGLFDQVRIEYLLNTSVINTAIATCAIYYDGYKR
jgi:hypothetical protein